MWSIISSIIITIIIIIIIIIITIIIITFIVFLGGNGKLISVNIVTKIRKREDKKD